MNIEERTNDTVKRDMTSITLPPRYDFTRYEEQWRDYWETHQIHTFKRDDTDRPTYTIDTPPPYPSGEFHMGNALNWCYIDFIARYKRLRGYNVHFPQGWDCHGLPTEVRAEKTFKVKKRDLSIQEFTDLCIKLTDDYIDRMRSVMKRIGLSTDWALEYKTINP